MVGFTWAIIWVHCLVPCLALCLCLLSPISPDSKVLTSAAYRACPWNWMTLLHHKDILLRQVLACDICTVHMVLQVVTLVLCKCTWNHHTASYACVFLNISKVHCSSTTCTNVSQAAVKVWDPRQNCQFHTRRERERSWHCRLDSQKSAYRTYQTLMLPVTGTYWKAWQKLHLLWTAWDTLYLELPWVSQMPAVRGGSALMPMLVWVNT